VNDFIEQFVIEGRDLVEQATGDLLALERQTGDATRLDAVFRAFHTLKGAAGIVEFAAMARALHAAEGALSAVRAGTDPMTPTLIGNCLASLDRVLQWLDAIEAAGSPPSSADADADALVARFAGGAGAASVIASARSGSPATDWVDRAWIQQAATPGAARVAIRYRPDRECFLHGEDPLAVLARLPDLLAIRLVPVARWPVLDAFDPFACQLTLLALSAASPEAAADALRPVLNQVEIVELDQRATTPERLGRDIIAAQIRMLAAWVAEDLHGRLSSAGRVADSVLRHSGRTADADRIGAALAAAAAARDAAPLIAALQAVLADSSQPPQRDQAQPTHQEAPARSLRVDVERIDALVRLAAELTVVKNSLGHLSGLADAGADPKQLAASLKDQHGRFDRLTIDLQRAALNIRVLPLRHVFRRFPRLMRDLGASLGKPIRLLTEGDDTEADKAIVETLFEPLLHLLRNAADHGLEDAQTRRAAGKPPVGTIRLRAARRGEHVIVEVEDDGRGVDVERVRDVAARRGIASAEALAAMSDAEIADLIFAPGFSTVAQITDVSGRGVGMDAVRAAVERVGGRVNVQSEAQRGATVRLTLPFTVMFTRVVTVAAGGQMFGIPLESVVETVRIGREEISPIGAASAFVLRNHTIPIVNLAETLGIATVQPRPAEALVVVSTIDGNLGGLEVDGLGGRMDVMLKPMDGLLSGTRGLAGTTLLGDGRVLLVLDLEDLLG
jgi:two-component system chemotaxis sensor kinase CheA